MKIYIYKKNGIYCIIDGDFIGFFYKKKNISFFSNLNLSFSFILEMGAGLPEVFKKNPSTYSLFWCCSFDLAEINLHWALQGSRFFIIRHIQNHTGYNQ